MTRIRCESITVPAELFTALTNPEREALKKLSQGKLVLECGAELGTSTVILAQRAKKVFSIDWQKGDSSTGQRETAYESGPFGPVPMWQFFTHGWIHHLFRLHVMHNVVPIVGAFEDVLPLFGSGVFDMAFLDGDHQYDAVRRDTDLILPHLAAGATFAFHDYGRECDETRPGVKYGVTQVVDSLGKEVQTVGHLAWVVV